MPALPLLESKYRTRIWTIALSVLSVNILAEGHNENTFGTCPGNDPRTVTWKEPDSYATAGAITVGSGWSLQWSVGFDLKIGSEANVWTDPDEAEYPPGSGCWDYIGPQEAGYRPLVFEGELVTTFKLIGPGGQIDTWDETEPFEYDAYLTPAAWSTYYPFGWGTPGNVGFRGDVKAEHLVSLSVTGEFDLEGDFSNPPHLHMQERSPAGRNWTVSAGSYGGSIQGAETIIANGNDQPQSMSVSFSVSQFLGGWLNDPQELVSASFSRSASKHPPEPINYETCEYDIHNYEAKISISGNTFAVELTDKPTTQLNFSFTDRYSPVKTMYFGDLKYIDGSSIDFEPDFRDQQLRPPFWVEPNGDPFGYWTYQYPTQWHEWSISKQFEYPGGWTLNCSSSGGGLLTADQPYVTSSIAAEYEGCPEAIGHIQFVPPAGEDSGDVTVPLISNQLTPLTRDRALKITVAKPTSPVVFEKTTGWGATNCSIQADGTRLRIYNTSHGARVDRLFDDVRIGGARFLSIDAWCSSAKARCTLVVGEQKYEIRTGPAETIRNVVIDLCRPECSLVSIGDDETLKACDNGALMMNPISGGLMRECCDWDCEEDEQQNSLIERELPWGEEGDDVWHEWVMRRGFGPSRLIGVGIWDIAAGDEWRFSVFHLVHNELPRIWIVPTGPGGETLRTIPLNDKGLSTNHTTRPVAITVDGKIILEGIEYGNMHESPGTAPHSGPWFPLDSYENPTEVQTNGVITLEPDEPAAGTFYDSWNTLDHLVHNWGGNAEGWHAAQVRTHSAVMSNGFGSLVWRLSKYLRSAAWGLAFNGGRPRLGGFVKIEDSDGNIHNAAIEHAGQYVSDGMYPGSATFEDVLIRHGHPNRELQRTILTK